MNRRKGGVGRPVYGDTDKPRARLPTAPAGMGLPACRAF